MTNEEAFKIAYEKKKARRDPSKFKTLADELKEQETLR